MNFQPINMDGFECQAIFANPTGARINITSDKVTMKRAGDDSIINISSDPVRFNATATDVFMKIDGIPHRLFVDVDVELSSGLKYIWLTDGPAVIRY